jgi:hypothetical protein
MGVTLPLVAVGTATEGDRKLYVVGGRELDREFLSTPGAARRHARAALSQPGSRFQPSELIDAAGRRPVPRSCAR